MSKAPVLTIDGPSGSGKGTIGWRVAQQLGWGFLDSGALYRLVALSAIKNQVALDDVAGLVKVASSLPVHFEKGQTQQAHFRIMLDNEDVTMAVRTEETGAAASKVAALKEVRKALLDRQRAFRQAPGLVADGRDMGTVVFPDAEVKVFLTASAEERARRRVNQLNEKGIDANLEQILADIQARDARDSGRSVSPLVPASDAVVIDTTSTSIEDVERRVFALIEERLP